MRLAFGSIASYRERIERKETIVIGKARPERLRAPAESRASSGMARQQTFELPASAQQVASETGSITFVGTATVIIRYAGLTILTDPNFLHQGDHVHLGYGLTAERLTNPAIELGDLPPIDLVVLSHMHGDHFDQLVQREMNKDIPIVSTPEAVRKLRKFGFHQRYALQTWDSLRVKKGDATLRVSATPGRHGPPVVAGLEPEVMG